MLVGLGLTLSRLVNPFVGLSVMLAALGLSVYLGWWLARRLPLPYAWGFATLALCGLGGVAAGRPFSDEVVRREIPILEAALTARAGRRSFEVQGSLLFQKGWVSSGPGRGDRATFGLRDGSLLERVSDATHWTREAGRQCSREIMPGWYLRGRCADHMRERLAKQRRRSASAP